ncbi:hypothetical protein [Gordonia metallireducens]|uniref:hypothetical protein n=1 Tax=Gordonia metallireducens TaxID=2897779 RepID=UPI001E44CFEF|nr:hypothetical protein [Gordonia metallireducens]
MGSLRGPVDALSDGTAQRQAKFVPALYGTSVSLKQAAWNYTSTDHDASLGIRNTETTEYNSNPFASPLLVELGVVSDPVRRYEAVRDVDGAHAFPPPQTVDVSPPPAENVDWNAIISETAGWLADADAFIKDLSGWSPIEAALEPVAGNFTELKRIGKTYGKSGAALTAAASDLATGHREVDSHWDGRAAVAYSSYSFDMQRGLEWEGAVGRLIDRGLAKAAEALEAAAKAVVELVKKGLSRIVRVDGFTGALKLAAKFVPGAGTAAAIAEVTAMLVEVGQQADSLVKEVKEGIDALKTFLAFCEDPIGFAKGKAEDRIMDELKPFTDYVDKVEDRGELTADTLTTADIDRLADTPSDAYAPGTGPELWEDAK